MIRFFLPLLVFLALAAAPARAGYTEVSFKFGGLTREAAFYVPDGLTGPAPLVLAVHGVLESGRTMRRVSQRRFEAFADQFGYVIAYPSAYQRVWDFGEGSGAAQLFPRRDDLAYLEQVINEAKILAPIDPRRIFSVGFSQGGMMSFALACKRPGLIRAVGSVAMSLPALLTDDCARALPEGVLVLHGTLDPVVPFEGGEIISGPNARMTLLSFEDTVAYFSRRKGCGAPSLQRIYDAKDEGTAVERRLWLRCRSGAVEAFRIEGSGHRWPASRAHPPFAPITGEPTQEIDGAAAAIGFFSRFR